MLLLRRSVLIPGLALLLSACGTGGYDPDSLLAAISDQTTLVDEPLVVELGVALGAAEIEAEAYDPDGVLAVRPSVEGTSVSRSLLLSPSPLATGEALVTVTARNGSTRDSETFRLGVMPPYRSVAQTFDLSEDPESDTFRASIAVDGATVVVGTPYSAGEGIDDSGAVYVFELVDDSWQLSAKLLASDLRGEHEFGFAVDVSDDRIIVGAPQDDDVASNAGAAYIFERDGEGWSQTAKLLPALEGGTYQDYGRSVALDGDIAVVGASRGDSDDLIDNGQVYVYERVNRLSWLQRGMLTASDDTHHDNFGERVAVDESMIVAVVPGRFGFSPGRSFGAAYVFEGGNDGWEQTARLTPIELESESFGIALAIEGDTIAVGAPHYSIVTQDGEFPGAIYVFERSEEEFYRATKLVTGSSAADAFGARLALSGDYILATVHENGESRLHLYKRNAGSWALVNVLPASELDAADLGPGLVLSRDFAVIPGSKDGETSFHHLPR